MQSTAGAARAGQLNVDLNLLMGESQGPSVVESPDHPACMVDGGNHDGTETVA